MAEMSKGEMAECMRICLECHAICVETAARCLDMGGKHASREHQTLLLECAEICRTSAFFLAQQSSRHAITCSACAEICAACAADCDRLADGDAAMKRCADLCRRCAESCRKMAGGRSQQTSAAHGGR
jgi:hypothetical protein